MATDVHRNAPDKIRMRVGGSDTRIDVGIVRVGKSALGQFATPREIQRHEHARSGRLVSIIEIIGQRIRTRIALRKRRGDAVREHVLVC